MHAIDGQGKPGTGKRLLAIAPVSAYGGNNTSIHRVHALEALGFEVKKLDSAGASLSTFEHLKSRICNQLFQRGIPARLPDPLSINSRLMEAVRQNRWDVLWVDKCMNLSADSLRAFSSVQPHTLKIGYSPDDMDARHNQSRQFLETLPLYDVFLTTKTYNVEELQARGCRDVRFIGNAYDPASFRPLPVSNKEIHDLGGDIGFIGTFEEDRARFLYELAAAGLPVRIWGGGWEKMRNTHPNLRLEKKPLYGDLFAKACGAFKINLNFLRKINRDRQTTRSVEIPACRGFMLAERTEEHQELFQEGVEADYFSSLDELKAKCQQYLEDDDARNRVAAAGYRRCLDSDYSNEGRLRAALLDLEKIRFNHA